MFFRKLKLLLIFTLLYQSPCNSKSNSLNELNSRYLANYFSGIVAYENKNNTEALKFFKSSKILINKHDSYLKRYIYSLVLEGKVQQATNELKQNFGKNNSDFFEAYLLISLDYLKKGNFEKSNNYILKTQKFINKDRISIAIHETLKQYFYVFENNKILKEKKILGNLSLISEAFQRCYLGDQKTDIYFLQLINDQEADYSRYIYFYISYLINNKRLEEAKKITDELDYLNSTLLNAQGKKWIDQNKLNEFNKIFSCKNQKDVVSEFLFLIANLYSSQNDYEKSNFYLNISHFLNPKFKFNLSLMAENYYLNKNYLKAKKIFNNFEEKNELYYWYRIKKNAQIISMEKSKEEGLDYINSEFDKIKKPNIKMIFDIANFNRSVKKYKRAITYYDELISIINKENSEVYANILYRRGGSHERLKNYQKSDEDLFKAIEINPNDAYTLNYLAYSWLERDYKIDEAIMFLEEAYSLESNDPYIIDSIGWAYYLVDDFLKAENYLRRAVELMPNDPIVNDHYGDILWKLNRKIQARYFWKNVMNLKETEDEMKKNIRDKLLKGLTNS